MAINSSVSFLGEYECRLDTKSRILIPSGLQRQLPLEAGGRFVINRGFEKCLNIFPWTEWEKIAAEVNALNPYVKENREFIRYFFRGATELQLDTANRLLLPKRLLDYLEADKDLILFAHGNRIEVWPQEKYDNMMDDEPADFSLLAERVMGGRTNEA
jgi:MraZ protein